MAKTGKQVRDMLLFYPGATLFRKVARIFSEILSKARSQPRFSLMRKGAKLICSGLRIFAKNGTQIASPGLLAQLYGRKIRNMRIRHGRREGSVLMVMVVVMAI